MDIREVPGYDFHRHPWEISRTQKSITLISRLLRPLRREGRPLMLANIGAGDMYFDREYLKHFPNDVIYAVDMEYTDFDSGHAGLFMANSIDDIEGVVFDAVVMMNLLEYIEDEVVFLDNLIRRVSAGGFLFFILPAFQFLYSEHDIYVKGLRRYSAAEFRVIIRLTHGIELTNCFYFYLSLFGIRAMKKLFRFPTDNNEKNLVRWRYARKNPVTRFFVTLLNIDFDLSHWMQHRRVRIPGLSLFAVCRHSPAGHQSGTGSAE